MIHRRISPFASASSALVAMVANFAKPQVEVFASDEVRDSRLGKRGGDALCLSRRHAGGFEPIRQLQRVEGDGHDRGPILHLARVLGE
jgi:hypothetical protein